MPEIKSININTVFDKKEIKNNLNKPLIQVEGFAMDYFMNHTKFGENVGFKGDFVAVNLLTGEVFESSAIFLPKQFTETLQAKLEATQGGEVQFSGVIKATESEKSPLGYAWILDMPETEARVNRRKQLLLAATEQAKTLALPAPKKK